MVLTRCTQTGDWATAKTCDDFKRGTAFFALGTFSQTDTTVTAVMDLGDSIGDFPSAPVAATIAANGELRFETIHRDGSVTIRSQWAFRPVGLTQIEGTVVIRATAAGISGYFENAADILPTSVTRSLTSGGGTGFRQSVLDALRRRL